MALLSINSVGMNFGALRVLDDVNMEVEERSLHAVVGPNGAGKTTLFSLISGFYRATEGEIMFNGTQLSKVPPHRMAHLGLRRSFQIRTLL